MLKILVVEDHTLVREGLVRLLAQFAREVVVRECGDFEAAAALLAEEDEFDLVLLDLALPGIDGFAALDILRQNYPAIPVAVVSAFDDQPTVTRVMNLGASGFIPKAFSGEDLLRAVRAILDGELFYPTSIVIGARLDNMTAVPPGSAGVHPAEIGLTDRQAQVLALMVRGLSNRDIAQQLGLSEGTVKIHATAIFKALGVGSRTQALVTVSRYGVDFSKVF